jgi:DNA-binding CsgD family transcriptional regulator
MDEQLSEQDHHALMMLGAGHSAVETAASLGVQLPVLAARLAQLRGLLGVHSTAAAIDAVLGKHRT